MKERIPTESLARVWHTVGTQEFLLLPKYVTYSVSPADERSPVSSSPSSLCEVRASFCYLDPRTADWVSLAR